jgi:MFS family permease
VATPNEPALILLSMVVVVFTTLGLGMAIGNSIPYAVARVRQYERGTAHHLYALFILFVVAVPAVCLGLFFTSGLAMLLVTDPEWRMGYVRISLALGIVLLCAMVVVTPFWARYIEEASGRERAAKKERSDA